MENKDHKLLARGIAFLLILIAVVGVVGYFVSRQKGMTVQGEAEATEYRVSGKVPGRVETLFVKEGDKVCKGDTVVFINSPEVQAKMAQAQAVRSAASAQNNKARNGARKEQIAGAYEVWQSALVQKEVMRKSFERMQTLYEKKVVPAQKYDEVKAKYDASVAQAAAAESQYNMAVAGAREEDRQAAAALLAQADGAVREVDGYMNELYLVSPADGIISAIFPHTGELVGTGAPIMTVTDLSDMWFTFNIREDYLEGMKIGNTLNLEIPALGGQKCTAKVTYMAVRDSYATWKATKEIGQYDAKTFEVRAVPTAPVEGLLPGMTALLVR